MRRVFADSFFYIAVLNRKDVAHERAIEFFASKQRSEIITTTAVMFEVGDALNGTKFRVGCAEFLATLGNQPRTKLRHVSEGLFERGLELYRKRPDKAWSLTDCVSFIVMSEEGLTEALTADHHFEQAGFTALLAE